MKKYLIIQPHSDDALFNCFHILINPELEVEVLTIENDPKRSEEDRNLYGFLQIPVHHLDLQFKDESYYGYFKEYKETTDADSMEYLKRYFGTEKVKEIEKSVVKWVKSYVKKHPGVKILVPWGVGHPFHLFVRDIIANNFPPEDVQYYREFPHSYKRRSKHQVEVQSAQYELIESVPVQDFHEIKWQLASKFYRSQSGLLFFEHGYIEKKLPEEIYAKPGDDLPF